MRLDVFLIEKKLAPSRTQAQDYIQSGYVFLIKNDKETPLTKPGYKVPNDQMEFIFVKKNELQKFVSRGGLKLEKAIQQLGLNLKGKTALDIGQSTGGFTDCLLSFEVAKVVGVDVGHDQLHEKIRNHPQVEFFEGAHVKDLPSHKNFLKSVPAGGFDFIVADVSFISLTKVMPFLTDFLKKEGEYLFLVKPQFELTAKDLDKNGIVKNPESYSLVQNQIEQDARQCFGDVLKYLRSETLGKDGNQEFFIYGRKTK